MVFDRYIAKNVLISSLLASFVLLSVFSFVDFTAQLSSMGVGDYGALQAGVYVLLKLPQKFYELSPSILLLGGILSLGAMAGNSELIVMRASGISPLKITRRVLQVGFVIALFVFLLGEYIVPSASRAAKNYRAQAMDKKILLSGAKSIWARDGAKYINIKKIYPDYRLENIRIFEFDKHQKLKQMQHAQNANYQNNQWVLNNVKVTQLTDEKIKTVLKKQIKTPHLLSLELFSVLALELKDMSASELLAYSNYLASNKLETKEYRLAFWIKVFTPLTCLAMLFLAMPIVLSSSPRSGGTGQRVMVAILIGVVYFVLNSIINYLGLAVDVSPFISASLPLVLVLLGSSYFMKKIN